MNFKDLKYYPYHLNAQKNMLYNTCIWYTVNIRKDKTFVIEIEGEEITYLRNEIYKFNTPS